VTDRRTDGRTELRWLRRAIAVPAVARKKRSAQHQLALLDVLNDKFVAGLTGFSLVQAIINITLEIFGGIFVIMSPSPNIGGTCPPCPIWIDAPGYVKSPIITTDEYW